MNKSGIGVVIRNSQGLVFASLLQQVSQAYSPLEVDTLATKRTIQFASELDIISVVLEGDSQVLIQSVQSGVEYLSPSGLLRLVSISFNQLSYSQREDNKIVHNLIRFVINVQNFPMWIKDIPSQFISFLQADLTSIS